MSQWGRRLAIAAVAAIALALVGVSVCRHPNAETSIPLARVALAEEALGPACTPADAGAAEASTDSDVAALGTVHLRLLLGHDVTAADAAGQLGRVRSYLGPRGLTVELADAHWLAIDELLTLSPQDLDSALEAQGLDPHGDGQAERQATARLLLAPIRSFLEAHGAHRDDPTGLVQVVFLRRISATDSVARRVLPGLRGLALDRHGALADLPAPLRNALGSSQAPPTVFLSLADLAPAGSGIVDTTLMHELGHALGLAHVVDPHNLMSPSPHRCIPSLDTAQRQALAARLASPQ